MYGIADSEQVESIVKNVLMNEDVTAITTPYFEGYELDAMGKVGELGFIEDKLLSYWKGMLDLGATTIWEEFDPQMSGIEHYAMYDNRYGKSLCHAWGTTPIYLLGRYYLGVRPTSFGYESFEVEPRLGGFSFIKGTVPIKDGEVLVHMTRDRLCVKATRGGGTLIYCGERHELPSGEEVTFQRKK